MARWQEGDAHVAARTDGRRRQGTRRGSLMGMLTCARVVGPGDVGADVVAVGLVAVAGPDGPASGPVRHGRGWRSRGSGSACL